MYSMIPNQLLVGDQMDSSREVVAGIFESSYLNIEVALLL